MRKIEKGETHTLKKYYEQNREKVNAYRNAWNKKYREDNREKEKALNKKYREENGEKVKAKHKKYSAIVRNKITKKERKINFGDNRYENFKDDMKAEGIEKYMESKVLNDTV